MKTIGRKIPRKMLGSSTALCATCATRYYRRQLVRGRDGLLRCSGSGTLNDARGRIEVELDELNSGNALTGSIQRRLSDDPGPLDIGGDI